MSRPVLGPTVSSVQHHVKDGVSLHPCPPTALEALGVASRSWGPGQQKQGSSSIWLALSDCQQSLWPSKGWTREVCSTWGPDNLDNVPLHDILWGLTAGCRIFTCMDFLDGALASHVTCHPRRLLSLGCSPRQEMLQLGGTMYPPAPADAQPNV